MKSKLRYLPNCLTMVRVVGTVGMLFAEPLSKAFYILYIIAGVSDVADGAVARATGCVSELGSKLDSLADLLFYAAMILLLFPILWEVLPGYIWVAVLVALILRLVGYGVVLVKYRQFASQHTYLNKLSGFFAFGLPFVIRTAAGVAYCTLTAAVLLLAAVEELSLHLLSKTYDPSRRTIFATITSRGDHKSTDV